MGQLSSDQIGVLGELIAAASLSRPVGGRFDRALFRAIPLGEKHPVADFLVALLEADGGSAGFFFVQVKSTNKSEDVERKLRIKMRAKDFNALVRLPIPTYIVAVNVATNEAFLSAATRQRRTSISRIEKSYNLSSEMVRIELYNEVSSFWHTVQGIFHNSRFEHD